MARAAAAGHRVVVVFATDGGAGLASSAYGSRGRMGPVRRAEARAAARVLGAGRVEFLGYADSGMAGEPSGLAGPFSAADRDEAAERLAAVLRDERADVVTSYDPLRGYGHPDPLQGHPVGPPAPRCCWRPPSTGPRCAGRCGWCPGCPGCRRASTPGSSTGRTRRAAS